MAGGRLRQPLSTGGTSVNFRARSRSDTRVPLVHAVSRNP